MLLAATVTGAVRWFRIKVVKIVKTGRFVLADVSAPAAGQRRSTEG
jgi:hypothetical protein